MDDAAGLPGANAPEIAVANAINNMNGRGRVLVGGVGGLGGGGAQNNMMNMRDRLFHAIYFRVAATYAELVPRWMQLLIEFMLLAKALLFFFTLVYVHTAFIKNPCTCLQNITDWPSEGVLRVEIIQHLMKKRDIWLRLRADQEVVQSLKENYYYGIGPQTKKNLDHLHRYENNLRKLGMPIRPNFAYGNETLHYYFDAIKILEDFTDPSLIPYRLGEDDDEQYIVEYSLEYGHLRLAAATRKRLNIPVLRVQLDPDKNVCFGDELTRYLLKTLLGYDDLLMASVRTIAEKEDNKGYLRNVITGEHYRFISMWWAAWSSYPAAFCVMLLFTFSVSMLLRYSHHQIFVFIVDLLQMLEYNVSARFPIAPLLTVILALVGMEAIMSEFFNDSTTAFYMILIVWIADQFDAICCHTPITKRHWLRFFFLYHFAFYAYHYRFSGQFRTLALLTSYLFIQHSMLFFFHRYELPAIMAQRHIFLITRNSPDAENDVQAGAGNEAEVDVQAGQGRFARAAAQPQAAPVDQQAAVQGARTNVVRIFRHLVAQRQRQGGAAPIAVVAEPVNNPTLPVVALGNLRRLPLVGQWLQGRQQFATVRRVVMGQGHGQGQMMQVRLQRVNLADIPGLQTRAAAAAATTPTAPATATSTGATAKTTTTAGAAVAKSGDVESNQGREACDPASMLAAAEVRAAKNGINDAGAAITVGQLGKATAAAAAAATTTTAETATTGMAAGAAATSAETAQDAKPMGRLSELDQEADVAKMLKNLNSIAADIINMPDTTTAAAAAAVAAATATTTATRVMAKTTSAEQPRLLLPLAKQLANNLPAQRIQWTEKQLAEWQTSSSGESQSELTEQLEKNMPQMCEQQSAKAETQNKPATAAATAAVAPVAAAAFSCLGPFDFPARATAAETLAPAIGAATMMDGRQTVDFIEGDSNTSTANYVANNITNRMEAQHKQRWDLLPGTELEKQQEQQQQQQQQHEQEQPQLKTEQMKTLPHISNQVTTAAEAATSSSN